MDEAKDRIRQRAQETKDGALYVFLMENRELIDFKGVAERYFERTGQWMRKRIRPFEIDGKMTKLAFTEDEFSTMVIAMRDIANKLNETADAIEKGRMKA